MDFFSTSCISTFFSTFTLNFYKCIKFIVIYSRFIVTSEFQAIVKCSNLLFTTLIFVNDTSHTVFTVMAVYTIMTISTIYTFGTFFYMDIYTISTIKTIYTVFTIDTNLTIFTIFTNMNRFYIKIFIQCIVNSCITITIISLFYSHVFTSLEINRFTIFNFLCSITSMSTYCSRFCRRCYMEGTHIPTSWQVRQIDNCFCISYSITIAIIKCQFNLFSCCIVFVCLSCCAWDSITRCCPTFCFSRTRFYRSWSNV